MRRTLLLSTLFGAGTLAFAATAAFAQSPSPAQVATQSPTAAMGDTTARARLAAVKGTLRNMVVAQEVYFRGHHSYTTDVVAIWGALPGPQAPDSSIVVSVTHAGGRAWRATAQHRALPSRSCVISIGEAADFPMPKTKASGLMPREDQEGVILCDAP